MPCGLQSCPRTAFSSEFSDDALPQVRGSLQESGFFSGVWGQVMAHVSGAPSRVTNYPPHYTFPSGHPQKVLPEAPAVHLTQAPLRRQPPGPVQHHLGNASSSLQWSWAFSAKPCPRRSSAKWVRWRLLGLVQGTLKVLSPGSWLPAEHTALLPPAKTCWRFPEFLALALALASEKMAFPGEFPPTAAS